MARLGTVTLQANDKADLFLCEDVYPDGIKDSREAATEIDEAGFDTDKAWVTGSVPKVISVEVDGDVSIIYGWFRGENFTVPFTLCIYVEYEDVEELMPKEEKP